jgi:hypothetical protein
MPSWSLLSHGQHHRLIDNDGKIGARVLLFLLGQIY